MIDFARAVAHERTSSSPHPGRLPTSSHVICGKATDGTRDQSYTQEGCRQGSVARVSKQRAHTFTAPCASQEHATPRHLEASDGTESTVSTARVFRFRASHNLADGRIGCPQGMPTRRLQRACFPHQSRRNRPRLHQRTAPLLPRRKDVGVRAGLCGQAQERRLPLLSRRCPGVESLAIFRWRRGLNTSLHDPDS